MKKRNNIIVIIIIIIIIMFLVICLVPQKSTLKDGGTEVYSTLLYTVKKQHQLIGNEDGKIIGRGRGTIVKILSFTVYNDTEPRIED